jgi:cholesterol transport system auxiliary component
MKMMNTIKFIAACAINTWAIACFGLKNSLKQPLQHLLQQLPQHLQHLQQQRTAGRYLAWPLAALLLSACATPQAPVAKAVYDFGPVLSAPIAAPTAPWPALGLAEVQASAALQTNSMLYRLGYADAQQLRAYTQASWSMPPAQLLRARLRDALASRGPVLAADEGAPAWQLRVELDEFSQWFDSPARSSGLVRLRASVVQGNALLAQRSFSARASAPTQDAAGGVKALAAASDEAVQQLSEWLAQQRLP